MKRNQSGQLVSLPAGIRTVSMLLKCAVFVSAAVGVAMSAAAGRRAFMGGSRVFMYFTIQSNIASALISLIGAVQMARDGGIRRSWAIVQFIGAVSITLTGMVFCFVLAPVLGRYAWSTANVLTHVAVPVLAVADFLLACAPARPGNRCVFLALLPPLAYAVYAGIGYAAGWEFSDGVCYPYFFLNWGSPAGALGFTDSLPYMGCVWWILAIFLFLLAAGRFYLFLLDCINRCSGR